MMCSGIKVSFRPRKIFRFDESLASPKRRFRR